MKMIFRVQQRGRLRRPGSVRGRRRKVQRRLRRAAQHGLLQHERAI